jgi:O-antigen/teichoic acid export membrane protein
VASLRQNLSWTLAGNIAYAGCQWLVIALIAKLGSQQMVGQFTLGVAVCAPIMLMTGLALRVVQANDVRSERTFATYLGLRLIATCVALLAIAVITAVGSYSRVTSLVILLVAAAKAAEATSEIVWGQLQQQEHMSSIARSMMLKGSLSVVAVAGLLAATSDLVLATAGFTAAWIGTLVLYDLPVGRSKFFSSLRPSFERSALIRLARIAFPLGIVVMLASYSVNIPRYFIISFRNESQLGVFSAIANLMLVGTTMMTALGQSVTPRLARSYLDGDRARFLRLLRLLIAAAVALGGLGVLVAATIGEQVLTLLYTPDYAHSTEVFVLVMVAAFASYFGNMFGVAVVAAGEFRLPVPLHVLNIGLVIVGSLLAVERAGTVGAAWVLVVSNVVMAIGFGMLVVRCIRRMRHGAANAD